jgi:hypothetical protein
MDKARAFSSSPPHFQSILVLSPIAMAKNTTLPFGCPMPRLLNYFFYGVELL